MTPTRSSSCSSPSTAWAPKVEDRGDRHQARLSRRLMELMHGGLQIDSGMARGRPRSSPRVLPGTTGEPIGLPPPSQHGDLDSALRVLYAEDNDVNVEIVRQVVRLRPSVVFDSAETAHGARESRRGPARPILVDMHLGDMTGLELAQNLRRDPSTAHIRLVALRPTPARAGRGGVGDGVRGLPDQAGQLPGPAQRVGWTTTTRGAAA